MKQNKWTIYIGVPITAVSLVMAWYMDSICMNFWCNVLLGIFGSSFLTTVAAIINYRVERKRCLEAFFQSLVKARNNFARYKMSGDIERRVDIAIRMSEFDYTTLDSTYGDMAFVFFNKRTRQYIFDHIYQPIIEAKHALLDAEQHLDFYKNAINKNVEAARSVLKQLDEALVTTEERPAKEAQKHPATAWRSYNKIVGQLDNEIDWFYSRILYPAKGRKGKKENAD